MSLLDRLRSAYVAAPPWVRGAASGVLSLVPSSALYGKSYRAWRDRIALSETDAAGTGAFVRRSLSEVLAAARSTPFYRGIAAPDDIFDALAAMPIIAKEDVRDHAAEMAVVPLDQLSMVTTSGSSGTPLKAYLDRDRGAREIAFIHNVWARSGFAPGDARGVFRGAQVEAGDTGQMVWEAALKELRFSPFHLTDSHMATYAAALERRAIRFLHGYPSAISIFASYLLRAGNGWGATVRGIFPISEPLRSDQARLLAEAFPNATILPFYGLTEKAAFGDPVPDSPGRYAMNPLYGWAELVDDDGRPVTAPGTQGRLIGTSFVNRGLPLVRYDTDDLARLVAEPSAANSWRLVVEALAGRRRQEFIVSHDGGLISLAALEVHSRYFLTMREYMYRQIAPGDVALLAVPADGCSAADVAAYVADLQTKVGSGIAFHAQIVDHLPPAPRGKRRFVDQQLDLAAYAR